MKLSDFKTHLETHATKELTFILPDGGLIPAHAHVTEVGRVDKEFIDCGGAIRRVSSANLQAWVAADVEHRFSPGKLAKVLDRSMALFRGEDLEVEIEYEDGFLSQFPVVDAGADQGRVYFQLGMKHADCLAKETCAPKQEEAEAVGCCGGGGCR